MNFDMKSASIGGKLHFSRARVLWRDGTLRAFGVDGLLVELKTQSPVRLSGYINSWIAESDTGALIIKGKCLTCGGPKWWRVMRMPANDLWSST